MATTIDELVVKLSGDIKDFQSKMDAAKKKSEDTTSKMGRSFAKFRKKLNQSLGGVSALKVALGGLAAAFAFRSILKASITVEKLGVQFETLLGSASRARKQMKLLSDFAAKTPFQLEGIADSARQLLAFGFGADQIPEKLENIGDVAASTGSGMKELATIFGQVSAAGKLTGERLLQFQERAIPIGAALAKTLNVPRLAVRQLVADGKIQFKDFEKAFSSLTEKGGLFAGGMERQSKTVGGVLSTLKDNFFLLEAAAGKTFGPAIIDAAEQFTIIFQNLSNSVTKNGPQVASTLSKILDIFLITPAKFWTDFFFKGDESSTNINKINSSIDILNQRADTLLATLNEFKDNTLFNSFVGRKGQIQEELASIMVKLGEMTAARDKWNKNNSEASQKAEVETERRIAAERKETKAIEEQFAARAKLQADVAKITGKTTGADKEKQLEEEIQLLEQAKEQRIGIEEEVNQSIIAKQTELHEAKIANDELEMEQLLARNEMLQEVDAENNAAEIEKNQERINTLSAQEEERTNRSLAAKGKLAQANAFFQSQEVATVQQGLSNLTTLMRTKNKELFAIGKAAALANAIINTSQGFTKALSQGGILGPALGATVLAAGAVQIATISAQKLATGIDEVPGGGITDNFPALLQPGERVVPKNTNRDLKSFLNGQGKGGNQPVVFNNTFTGTFLGSEASALEMIEMINDATRKNGAILVAEVLSP